MKSSVTVSQMRPGEFPAVLAAAEADNDGVLFPTHVVRKGGEIVGALGFCSTPIVTFWMHSQKTHALDSIAVIERGEDALRFTGRRAVVVPVNRVSPFWGQMERLGYRRIIDGGLFIKENL